MLLKYKQEYYLVSDPKSLGHGRYTCTAVKDRTGRIITNPKALNELGRKLIRRVRSNET